MGGDSLGYSRWADSLIEHQFNYVAYLKDSSFHFPPFFYLGFVSVVALAKLLAGDYWPHALMVLNIVLGGLTGAMVFNLARLVTGRMVGGWAALVMYLACFEVFNWQRFALSDSIFLFLTVAIFRTIAGIFSRDDFPWKFLVGLVVLLGLALPFRPTSIALLPASASALWIWWNRRKCGDMDEYPGFRPSKAIVSVLLLLATFFMHTYFIQDHTRWPFGVFSRSLEYYAREYGEGRVVDGRPDTYHPEPISALDYALITADKLAHYFYFTAKDFSLKHNLTSSLFFVPVYLLVAVAIGGLMTRKVRISGRGEAIALASFFFIASFAILHAMTQVDFDWRYRLPIIPHLILFAAVGVATIQDVLCKRSMPHSIIAESR